MAAPHSQHSSTWSTPELLDLLVLWEEEAVQSQLCASHRNFDPYGEISCGMLEKSYEQDMHQCQVKIKELRQVYQKARESTRCSGAVLKTFCFYKELDAILCGISTSSAKSPVDTSRGLERVACGLNPKDEVVDEEVELRMRWNRQRGHLVMLWQARTSSQPWKVRASHSTLSLACIMQERGALVWSSQEPPTHQQSTSTR
ncbi:uncharacterized protein LOC119862742 [Dermochelys coriacea]|uniref:uncharacterized protein LOC119862742 n=1 Tax=Dermochelys coriacea TaxID=27794 RepID=UPI0018E7C026|nr:uncharacterized protein LOC119862742 [Dermochelys coriacea]